MHRSAREHRQEFEELGYTIFEAVLTPQEVAVASPIFDAIITSETAPPLVTGNESARRQLNSALYCEPRLSFYGGHPAVLETVAMLLDCPFHLTRTPVPTVTFSGQAGGVPGHNWSGHVDWHSKPPAPTDHLHRFGIIHFTTVQPNGGGFTLVPGSHHLVARNLNDSELAPRMFRQEFRDFPGLGPEQEMCAKAGDVLYYHPFMVHGASDNQSTHARKVLHTHYFPVLDEPIETRASIESHFHPDHLAAMDERWRKLIGLD